MFVGKETLEFELMLISAFFRVIIEKWGGEGGGAGAYENWSGYFSSFIAR